MAKDAFYSETMAIMEVAIEATVAVIKKSREENSTTAPGSRCQMHITIQEGRSLPALKRCTACCMDFHCPFCRSTLFQPAKLSKVRTHLETHFNRAVLHEGYTIHRCGLDCRPQWHYHCIHCQSVQLRKTDFIKHLSLCNKEKHPALTTCPSASIMQVLAREATRKINAIFSQLSASMMKEIEVLTAKVGQLEKEMQTLNGKAGNAIKFKDVLKGRPVLTEQDGLIVSTMEVGKLQEATDKDGEVVTARALLPQNGLVAEAENEENEGNSDSESVDTGEVEKEETKGDSKTETTSVSGGGPAEVVSTRVNSCDQEAATSSYKVKPTPEQNVVKRSLPWYRSTGSRESQSSSQDRLSPEGMKTTEQEPPAEPLVDNIPPSPFTLRASNCKQYLWPSRPDRTSPDGADGSSSTVPAAASAEVKPDNISTASASTVAAKAAKPAAGRGRLRDDTALHPSCLSVRSITMERSCDELALLVSPVDLGDAGHMKKRRRKKKQKKPTRFRPTQPKTKKEMKLEFFGFEDQADQRGEEVSEGGAAGGSSSSYNIKYVGFDDVSDSGKDRSQASLGSSVDDGSQPSSDTDEDGEPQESLAKGPSGRREEEGNLLVDTGERVELEGETLLADTGEVYGKAFCHKKSLKCHKPVHTDAKPLLFICKICSLGVTTRRGLLDHQRIHMGERPFRCSTCGKAFSQASNYREHKKMHSSDKPFRCSQCNKGFITEHVLKQHQVVHTRVKAYKCDVCGSRFGHLVNLKRHSLIHTGNKPFLCTVCGKSFNQSSILKAHMQVHAGTNHVCDTCSKAFVHNYTLARHQRCHLEDRERKVSEKRPQNCETCGKVFSRSSSLRKHQLLHTGQKPFKCDTCGRTFVHKSTCIRHQIVHTKDRSHICNVCGKGFSLSDSLKIHVRIHTGERPYACEVCGVAFRSSGPLKRHTLIHTGERPFSCEVCGLKFSQTGNLKKHMQVHSVSEKIPQNCETCGKVFSCVGSLRKHQLLHTGQKPFKCDTCGRTFVHKSTCIRHQIVHTKDRSHSHL